MITAADIANKFKGFNSELLQYYTPINTFPERVPPFCSMNEYYPVEVFEGAPDRIKTYSDIVTNACKKYNKSFEEIDNSLKTNWPSDKPQLLQALITKLPKLYEDKVVIYPDDERPKTFINITRIFAVADAVLKKVYPDIVFKGNGLFSIAYEESMAAKSIIYVKQATTLEDYLLTAMGGSGVRSCHAPDNFDYGFRFGQWTHLLNPCYVHFYLTDKTKINIKDYLIDKRTARINLVCGWSLQGKFNVTPSVEYAQVKHKGILRKWIDNMIQSLKLSVTDDFRENVATISSESFVKTNILPSFSADLVECYHVVDDKPVCVMSRTIKPLVDRETKFDRKPIYNNILLNPKIHLLKAN